MTTYVNLNRMPFDKVVDGQFVHATGMGILEDDGIIRYLYDDDDFVITDEDVIIDEDDIQR